MTKTVRTILLKYGITIVLAGLAFWGVLSIKEFSPELERMEQLNVLCDACFVPGVILTMFGALIWVSSVGAFDGLSWAMTNLVKSLVPGLAARKESYADYVERKRGKRMHGYGFLFHVGVVFLIASVVFLVLFLKADGTI